MPNKKTPNVSFWAELAKKVEKDIDTEVEIQLAERLAKIRIHGKTLDEAVRIIGALEYEKITGIEVTLENLDKLIMMMKIESKATMSKIVETAQRREAAQRGQE